MCTQTLGQPASVSVIYTLRITMLLYKLLVVHIDQELSFNDHIYRLCVQKLVQRIGTLRSIRHDLPLNERLTLYNATIKPVIMYGSFIWGSTSTNNIRRVFRLQKRAAGVILGVRTKEESTIKLFKKLDWLPFYDESRASFN